MSELIFTVETGNRSERTGKLVVNDRQYQTPLIVHTGNELNTLSATSLKDTKTQAVKVDGLRWWLNNGDDLNQLTDLHQLYHWNGLLMVNQRTAEAYRLAKPRGRKKDGVRFHDPATGQMRFYQPADGLAIQRALGADILQSFWRSDDYYAPVDDIQAAVEQTAEWLSELSTAQNISLGTVVGLGLKRQREKSIQQAINSRLAGYVLAGISTRVNDHEFNRVINESINLLPASGIRYLAGTRSLTQIILATLAGIDLIDSDLAMRKAENGTALIGACLTELHVARHHFAFDNEKLDAECECPVCQAGYTKAAIQHLVESNAILGKQLLLQHNLFRLNTLMVEIRQAITQGELETFIQELRHNP